MGKLKPTIPEFFKGRDIFITGGTGFMGKVLIEKLLRSCPELNRIFILIREKKSMCAQERVTRLLDFPLFDILKKENPEVLKKLIGIQGDVMVSKLGLTIADIERLANVSVIFHAAASVRFDDPLKDALLMNTRGTYEVLAFAEKLKNCQSIVHVSTTYCNPDYKTIEENIYPPKTDWRVAIKIAEHFDHDLINSLTLKYTNWAPNTYTFTKGLAEQVVKDFSDHLPIIIFRPSIVVSTMEEPVPGWIDNFNGPTGLLTACGLGIYRTCYGDPDVVSDFTPVDVAIKAMIVAAWKLAVDSSRQKQDVDVYNCSTSIQRAFTTGFIVSMGETLSAEVPLDKALWRPGGRMTRCKYYNYIKVILLHIIPAFIVDILLKLSGKKPFLSKLQRRIHWANIALHYFMSRHWVFKNDHFLSLSNYILSEDLESFRFNHFITHDMRNYFINCIIGARRYLLHEKDEDIPQAKRKYKRLSIIDQVVKIVFFGFLIYVVWNNKSFLTFGMVN